MPARAPQAPGIVLWRCEKCGFKNLPPDKACLICHETSPEHPTPAEAPALAIANPEGASILGRFLIAIGGLAAVAAVVAIVLVAQNPLPGPPARDGEGGVAGGVSRPSTASAPSDEPGTHTVRVGETPFSIASALGVSEEQLLWWNLDKYPSLRTNPRDIAVGWVLITAGEAMPTPTPRPTPKPTAAPTPGGGSLTLVALPKLTVDVWNAAEVYHGITGRNPSELTTSAETNSPSVCHSGPEDGMACAGPSTWNLQPTYSYDPISGVCTMTGSTAQVAYSAYLPQWTSPSPVPSTLLDWWRTVLDHIRWHEEQHVRIFVDYVSRLPGLFSGHPCSEAQAIIDSWSSSLNAAQAAFDADQRSWSPPPYSGPWDW